tara:strand:+ start:71 stop:394 length:324 start_codon:yes stop_codon:yes gene_type:complete
MVYVVDIDGTICSSTVSGDYEDSAPYMHRIEKINSLYEDGHTIIYFTARGMGRHNNNPVRAVQDFYSMTEVRLRQWGAKYHELILGKPAADVYIDDKGIEANEFFNK